MDTILVPVDLSDATATVVRVAKEMARALRARVCAMYAAMPITYTAASEAGPIISRAALADELKDYHRRLKAIEKQFAEDGIQAVGLVVEGNPVEQILREATRRNAGMIVIGSHGHGALYHLLLGSVGTGVLKRAACPVLVVPARTTPRAEPVAPEPLAATSG